MAGNLTQTTLQMLLSGAGSGLTISLYHNSSLSISTLTMEMVTENDSGNYTCQPSNTRTTSTTHLQVVDTVVGEELLMGSSSHILLNLFLLLSIVCVASLKTGWWW